MSIPLFSKFPVLEYLMNVGVGMTINQWKLIQRTVGPLYKLVKKKPTSMEGYCLNCHQKDPDATVKFRLNYSDGKWRLSNVHQSLPNHICDGEYEEESSAIIKKLV